MASVLGMTHTALPMRVVVVDDRPDVVDLLCLRFGLDPRLEVVGSGFHGGDAVRLCGSLRPSALVIDLDMPVLTGKEAIPLVRTASPETRIVVYTADDPGDLTGAAEPDALLVKGGDLKELVETLVSLAGTGLQSDILDIDLGAIPLEKAVAAFDSWVGLHVRIREALSRKPALTPAELSGISEVDLLALNGVFLRLGDQLVRAAQAGEATAHLALRTRRHVASATRRALVILGDDDVLSAFYEAWGHEDVAASRAALEELRHSLIEQLPL